MTKPRTQQNNYEHISSPTELVQQEPLIERGIGAIVMRLSLIHFLLEINLWTLLRVSTETGRILTEDLLLSKLAMKFYRAVEAKDPQSGTLKPLKNALKKLEKLNTKRNELVHSFWSFPNDGPPTIFSKKGTIISKKAPTFSEIQSLVYAIEQLIPELVECMARINGNRRP